MNSLLALLSLLCLIYICSSFQQANVSSEDGYFAMCLIVKDETEDVVEWIEYHHRMGASKFYIFDHNSTIPLLSSIQDFVTSGLVDHSVVHFSDTTDDPPQISVYNECLQRYGKQHTFMAFIDVDEFIVVVDGRKKIPDILRRHEHNGGLSLNWMLFGSSGHTERPPGGVIANYHKCTKNVHVKAIVNTAHCLRNAGNPHVFVYKPPYYSVDTNFTQVTGPFNPHLEHAFETMYINHYNTKSLAEFTHKMERGRGAMRNPHKYSAQYFHALDALCNDDCPVLQMPPG
jgi:hypothetical protein